MVSFLNYDVTRLYAHTRADVRIRRVDDAMVWPQRLRDIVLDVTIRVVGRTQFTCKIKYLFKLLDY